MTQDVYSPRPARPLKRALEPDYTHPNKRHRPSPLNDLCSKVPRPSSLSKSQTLASLSPVGTPASRPLSPSVATIHSWLLSIPDDPISRPSSAPARLAESKTVYIPTYQPLPLATIQEMFPSKRDPQASSQTAKPSTSRPLYRALLLSDKLRMDLSGDEIPPQVRTLINENILKGPSLPLPEESVREVRTMAKYLVESPEAAVSSLISPCSR